MNVEGQIDRFIKDVLKTEALEEAFNCLIVHGEEKELWRQKAYKDELNELIKSIPPENLESAISLYMDNVGSLCNQRAVHLLLSLLENVAATSEIPPRLLCDALLSSEKLVYQNEDFWCHSFLIIKKIISGVDYKGVRDLLKVILEKVHTIPTSFNVSTLKQLNAIQQVLELIFDRNACLLPSYLILDDIQKKGYQKTRWPHWKLGKMLTSFVDSFRPTAQMVSISGRSKLLPVVGMSSTLGNSWKLDPANAKFTVKGLLPYNKELQEPQTALLSYILEQPYSRDMVCHVLGLSNKHKQRCLVLEEQLVELMVAAMEKTENESETMEEGGPLSFLWQHLSGHLIYFVLLHHASFPHVVLSLHDKLAAKNCRKGRDYLMWILLQFISGAIQKNQLQDFLPLMKLYDLLYPEKDPLPLPDVTKPSATHALAVSSIWIHIMRKAQLDQVRIQRTLPIALKLHIEYLHQNLMNGNLSMSLTSDFSVSLLCNAFSTDTERFSRPMGVLVEAVQGSIRSQPAMSTCNSLVSGPVQPLSMTILDSLTVHTKMSLIHTIMNQVLKMAQNKSSLPPAPALVETYSRLLIYTEIESLGIKGFMSHLFPTMFRSQAWGILHTLLEMYIYRLHHIQAHYRIQLLGHIHNLTSIPPTNQTQLHLCMESVALKLITGLGSAEVQNHLSRYQNEPKTLLSAESEELNKALVLTLARAIHVTGSETLSVSWWKDILSTLMQNTPLSWSSFTLTCFPQVLAEFFQQYSVPRESKAQLKRSVEEEYRKWKTMNNENDMITHFSLHGTPPLFLCLLWKMLLENDRISPIAYKILDRIGARALSAHLRTFADFLVYEFANSVGGQHVNKCIDALNDLIWKCHVITLDKLILCLALRSFEGNEAQVCFFIIQLLLLRPPDFKSRVHDFVSENSPEHWKLTDWHEKHLAFHRRYPEKFYFEGLQDLSASSSQHTYLPVYFSNVCLRFLPVMDIVIHRFLEIQTASMSSMSVEALLDQLGCLYKFHDRPITYLYNTLHYYEQKLKDRASLKRKLVSAIIGSLKDIKPAGWALSDAFMSYMERPADDLDWVPDLEYYIKLIQRVVDTLTGKPPFPHTDWRFNEFPNPAAHALHVTCIEIMALPVPAASVGRAILDVILRGHTVLMRSAIESWMNAVGLVLTSLPESYWSVLNDLILEMMQNPLLSGTYPHHDPFQLMDFSGSHTSMTEVHCSYLVALTHAVWHHASIGQISVLPQLIKEKLKPVIHTEEQLLFLCHLVGPFLQRFHAERTRCMMEITVELYEILEQVDKSCEQLRYMDPICDLLYHIKYMFTGDAVKNEAERSIRNLRPALQKRLRFMAHLNIEEVAPS